MLVSFSFQNWMSFREEATISTVADRQRTHRGRVSRLKRYGERIVPIVAIYGGNASGKSNIFKALRFVKDFVVEGRKRDEAINVEPFVLLPEVKKQPSRFCLELLINEKIYEFSFSATNEYVCTEKLVEITPSKEEVLYERELDNITINKSKKPKGMEHLEYISTSTRKNQLFLTTTVDQNNKEYADIVGWFNDKFNLISPEATYGALEQMTGKNSPLHRVTIDMLKQLDTGISRLDSEDISDSDKEMIKAPWMADVMERLTGERYIKYKSDGDELWKRLVSYHENENGEEIQFDIGKESDGTMRLIDVLPAFLHLTLINKMVKKSMKTMVYMIDELDRSLHHLLVRRLINDYLDSCNLDSRTQIIFTTHDLLLMDQELFRRDEMFVTERDAYGATSIIPLNEYKGLRTDKDILKSYLHGRFGGIPDIR